MTERRQGSHLAPEYRSADWLTEIALAGNDLDQLEADGDSPLTGDFDESIGELLRAEALVKAATAARALIKRHVAMLLGDGGAYRDPNVVYRAGRRKPKRIVTPGSEDGLMAWLGKDLARAVNANAVRITDVRGIAEERHRTTVPIDEALKADFEAGVQGAVKAVESTFYTWDEDPESEPSWELTTVPIHRAPKFLQALEVGERYPSRE